MERKIVIVEPEYEYDGRGDKSTIIYYDWINPVILHRSVGGSKVLLSKRFHNKGHLNLSTEVLKGFSPGVFNSP